MVSKNRDARRKAKALAGVPSKSAVEKKIGGEKNGGTRTVTPKTSKYYPADDVKMPVASRRHVHKPTKLKKSITPGTVLILLASRHRGKRVVFLKQLDSGLLLVTGPYQLNGVPLGKVDQAYVMSTATKIDVSKVDLSKFDAAYFKRDKTTKIKQTEEGFMETEQPKNKQEIPESKIADQKIVDAVLMDEIKKDVMMRAYLRTRFSLTKGQYPHKMVF